MKRWAQIHDSHSLAHHGVNSWLPNHFGRDVEYGASNATKQLSREPQEKAVPEATAIPPNEEKHPHFYIYV